MMRSIRGAIPVVLAYSLVVFFAVLWAHYAQSQPPLTITTSGYYFTQVDSSGVPTLVQVTTIVDLRDGITNPDPPTDDEPIDPILAGKIRVWSDEVDRPQDSQAIAAVYAQIRGAIDDGLLDEITVWPALKDATDAVIVIVDGDDAWSDFRSKLSALVTEGRQRGTLGISTSISKMIRSVQHGLELSADGSDSLSLDKLVAIAAKTNEAIDANK